MAVRIRSLLVTGPLLVPLSSGGSVRLSPGEVTDELADVEVTNNAKVDKLRERRLIDVESIGEEDVPEPDEEPGSETPPAGAPRRGTRSRQR